MRGLHRTGAAALCELLEELGVACVFGVPGTQSVNLDAALRGSRLRSVTATHELAAAFMANGYARASGEVGVLVTIPGPGFACALTGLAEARLDSAPLLHLAVGPAGAPGNAFRLQEIDQPSIAAALVKASLSVEAGDELAPAVREAHAAARSGEPGPVLVQVAPSVLSGPAPPAKRSADGGGGPPPAPDPQLVEAAAARLAQADRVLLYAGQGASGASAQLRELAEALGAPVVATTSGRGVLPEDHPLALTLDAPGGGASLLNELVARSDLVLAVGCKFSHNGSAGFALRVSPDRLVHVDASEAVLGANYPAALEIRADAGAFLDGLLSGYRGRRAGGSGWRPGEIASWRRRAARLLESGAAEPRLVDVADGSARAFFLALRRALPRDGCLVTDSGLHQYLARRHFTALAPRSFVVPSDFQAMGFGLPAAIGARLARPERPVVALVGDGGLAASGLELLTAVRERIPLTVVVFRDGYFGLIRLEQLGAYGTEHGVTVRSPELAGFAESLGARYVRLEGDPEPLLRESIASPEVTLVDVLLADSGAIAGIRARGVARSIARALAGPFGAARLEDLWRRRR